jgi:large subunit ribosomal protein L9
MEVILLKAVKGLGQAGDIKRVAEGYARNYLVPRGLALIATDVARKQLAVEAATEARREAQEKARAETQATNLQKIELVFRARVGEQGRLYGSITSGDIAEQLSQKLGQEIDKRKILLEEPIKELGRSKVTVSLHPDVKIVVTVIIEGEAVS